MRTIAKVAILALSCMAPLAAHTQDLKCLDITAALKEFSISTSSTSYTNSVFAFGSEAEYQRLNSQRHRRPKLRTIHHFIHETVHKLR
mgnify:CR=1 FL=1